MSLNHIGLQFVIDIRIVWWIYVSPELSWQVDLDDMVDGLVEWVNEH
jgi:hypothetical protein